MWSLECDGLATMTMMALRILILSAIYFVLAKLGLSLATLHGNVSPVWPPTGFAIGLLLVGGRKYWPAVSLGAFLANYFTNIPLPAVLAIALGNTLEALVAQRIISWDSTHWKLVHEFQRPVKIIVGGAAGALVSAAVGAGALFLFAGTSLHGMGELFATWFGGNWLGALVLVPMFVAYQERQKMPATPRFEYAGLATIAIAFVVTSFVFFTREGGYVPFLVLPALLMCGASSRSCVLNLVSFLISVVAIAATSLGYGPFAIAETNSNLLFLQLFLAVVSISALIVSGLRTFAAARLAGRVLLAGWIVSNILFVLLNATTKATNEEHFLDLVKEVEQKIERRMRVYRDALLGGASLFAASESVEPDEWEAYVASLKIEERYPGIRGMGVISPVWRRDLPSFLAHAQKKFSPTFKVHEVTGSAKVESEDLFVITLIEPLRPNVQAQGFDIGSERTRRAAAERARATGLPAMTGKVALVQDEQKEPGFLLLVPFYRKGLPHGTVEERTKNLEAWIYAPFVARNFFAGIRDHWDTEIGLQVFQGLGQGADEQIYSTYETEAPSPEFTSSIELAGNPLTFAWSRAPGFRYINQSMAIWVSVVAAFIALLLAVLVASLSILEQRASELVEQRTAELELSKRQAEEAAQEARIASASKGAFLASMSHEIRTPLNGIVGMTNLMLDTSIDEEQREYLGTVKACSESLLTLINDILDLSKIEAGKLSVEIEPFKFRVVVKGTLMMLSAKALEKKIEMVSHVEPLIEEVLLGDKTRIGQVLVNLVGNALKFTPVGGAVMVHVRSLGFEDGKRKLQVSVSDTGIGIEKEKRQRIFEAFSQADASTTRKYGGTGLGLTISRQLVELMGGRMWVESEPGRGSVFHVALSLEPAKEVVVEETSVHVEKGAPLRPLNILLAEDNAVNQKLAVKILEKNGHRVTVAANGREALELYQSRAEKEGFDIILMDCQMPVLSGYEATKLLREYEKAAGGHVPVIAMTANAMDGDREACISAGMDDYITKPFQVEKLLELVRRWGASEYV